MISISLWKAPVGRLSPPLSRCSDSLPGIHESFSCMFDTEHPDLQVNQGRCAGLNYAASANVLLLFLEFIFNVPFLT